MRFAVKHHQATVEIQLTSENKRKDVNLNYKPK